MMLLATVFMICVLVLACWYLDELEKGKVPSPYNWSRDRELSRQLHQQAWDDLKDGEAAYRASLPQWDGKPGTTRQLLRDERLDPYRKAIAEDPSRRQFSDFTGIEL
jgi:hypothetical protein